MIIFEGICAFFDKNEYNLFFFANKMLNVFTRLRSRRVVMCLVVVFVCSFVRSFVRSFVPSLIESRVFNIF